MKRFLTFGAVAVLAVFLLMVLGRGFTPPPEDALAATKHERPFKVIECYSKTDSLVWNTLFTPTKNTWKYQYTIIANAGQVAGDTLRLVTYLSSGDSTTLAFPMIEAIALVSPVIPVRATGFRLQADFDGAQEVHMSVCAMYD